MIVVREKCSAKVINDIYHTYPTDGRQSVKLSSDEIPLRELVKSNWLSVTHSDFIIILAVFTRMLMLAV